MNIDAQEDGSLEISEIGLEGILLFILGWGAFQIAEENESLLVREPGQSNIYRWRNDGIGPTRTDIDITPIKEMLEEQRAIAEKILAIHDSGVRHFDTQDLWNQAVRLAGLVIAFDERARQRSRF